MPHERTLTFPRESFIRKVPEERGLTGVMHWLLEIGWGIPVNYPKQVDQVTLRTLPVEGAEHFYLHPEKDMLHHKTGVFRMLDKDALWLRTNGFTESFWVSIERAQ